MYAESLAREPIAIWNSARGVWETSQPNLLCEHSVPYSETWQTSGMTQGGRAFALLTPELLTTGSESSLLRSPKANDGARGALGETTARERGNSVQIGDQVIDLAAANGLKTSRADLIPQAVNDLFPTPIVRDYKDGQSEVLRNGEVQTDTVGRAVMNSGEVTPTSWGKFEPAIRRWEQVLGRPAPAPTKPDGQDGAHRLSSLFTEWLMGLEPGWITDAGLTRAEELKACGNGVVPQQAEFALRILLEGIPLESLAVPGVKLPTPMVSDVFTGNLQSTQQKEGSMHSVTLPQAVAMLGGDDRGEG